MVHEGGKVEVTEHVALVAVNRLGYPRWLLGVVPQLLHLGDEHLIIAIGLGAPCTALENLGSILLYQAPHVLGEDLHTVRVNKLERGQFPAN